MEALNLETGEYSPSKKINIKSEKVDLKSLINRDDKYGKYAWSVISKIIKYASSLVPGITKEFNDIDEAMRLGFNWSKGPFEMLEEIGVTNFFDKIDEYENNNFLKILSKLKMKNFMVKDKNILKLKLLEKLRRQPQVLMEIILHRFIDLKIIILLNLQQKQMLLIIIQWML